MSTGVVNDETTKAAATQSLPVDISLVSCVPADMEVSKTPLSESPLYKPLPDEYSFRLLILHPSTSRDAPVVCTLTLQSLRDTIEYTALSYEWGGPTPTQYITVNDQEVEVTPNLYQALVHLRSDVPGLLWVDALCINQSDIEERSQQVARMRDIYSQAHHVVSWLGSASERLRSEDPDEVAKEIYERSYWKRVWIMQEFLLANAVILVCGDVVFFEQGTPKQLHGSKGPTSFSRLRRGKAHHNIWKLHHSAFNSFCERRDASRNTSKPKVCTFSGAVKLAAQSEASDPRDYVYGVLGLLDDPSKILVKADYTRSACEVFCATVQALKRVAASSASSLDPRIPLDTEMWRIKHYRDFLESEVREEFQDLQRYKDYIQNPERRARRRDKPESNPGRPSVDTSQSCDREELEKLIKVRSADCRVLVKMMKDDPGILERAERTLSRVKELEETQEYAPSSIKACQGTCGTRELLRMWSKLPDKILGC